MEDERRSVKGSSHFSKVYLRSFDSKELRASPPKDKRFAITVSSPMRQVKPSQNLEEYWDSHFGDSCPYMEDPIGMDNCFRRSKKQQHVQNSHKIKNLSPERDRDISPVVKDYFADSKEKVPIDFSTGQVFFFEELSITDQNPTSGANTTSLFSPKATLADMERLQDAFIHSLDEKNNMIIRYEDLSNKFPGTPIVKDGNENKEHFPSDKNVQENHLLNEFKAEKTKLVTPITSNVKFFPIRNPKFMTAVEETTKEENATQQTQGKKSSRSSKKQQREDALTKVIRGEKSTEKNHSNAKVRLKILSVKELDDLINEEAKMIAEQQRESLECQCMGREEFSSMILSIASKCWKQISASAMGKARMVLRREMNKRRSILLSSMEKSDEKGISNPANKVPAIASLVNSQLFKELKAKQSSMMNDDGNLTSKSPKRIQMSSLRYSSLPDMFNVVQKVVNLPTEPPTEKHIALWKQFIHWIVKHSLLRNGDEFSIEKFLGTGKFAKVYSGDRQNVLDCILTRINLVESSLAIHTMKLSEESFDSSSSKFTQWIKPSSPSKTTLSIMNPSSPSSPTESMVETPGVSTSLLNSNTNLSNFRRGKASNFDRLKKLADICVSPSENVEDDQSLKIDTDSSRPPSRNNNESGYGSPASTSDMMMMMMGSSNLTRNGKEDTTTKSLKMYNSVLPVRMGSIDSGYRVTDASSARTFRMRMRMKTDESSLPLGNNSPHHPDVTAILMTPGIPCNPGKVAIKLMHYKSHHKACYKTYLNRDAGGSFLDEKSTSNEQKSMMEDGSALSHPQDDSQIKDGHGSNEEVSVLMPPLTYLEEVYREIQVLTRLNHPNLICLEGVILSPFLAIAVEYLNAGSLASNLQDFQWQSTVYLDDRSKIVLDIASGLSHMHTLGYIHRDIKPHNIMLNGRRGNWIAKLGDFGSAMNVSSTFHIYEAVGTSGYTAPEVLSELGYHLPADVFSFGMVAWEVFCNPMEYQCKDQQWTLDERLQSYRKVFDNPYSGKDPNVVVEMMEKGIRPYLDPSMFPENVMDMIECCWKFVPRERPTMNSIFHMLLYMI